MKISLPALSSSSLQWPRRKLLLLQFDAAGCRAVVAERRGGRWQLGPLLSADAPGPAQMLQALQQQAGRPLPRRCLMLSAAALGGLNDLPVDPAKPRPSAQMQEMIRYEMEPALAQHNNVWTLGEILGAKGLLTPAQRQQVALALENRRLAERHQPYRYGEVALAEGLIERAQLDACLTRQAELQLLDSELALAWQGRREVAQEWPRWRVACCTAGSRDGWREALAAHGVRLLGIQPLLLSAFEAQAAACTQFVGIECHAEQWLCCLYQNGQLLQVLQEPSLERQPDAGWLCDLLAGWPLQPGCRIGLIATAESAPLLLQELQLRLRAEVNLLADSAETLCRLRFAALLAWHDQPRSSVRPPQLAPRAAATPLWQHPQGRLWLVLAVVLLVLAGWEGWARIKLQRLQRDHAALSQQARAQQNNPLQEIQKRSQQLEQQLAQRQKSLAAVLAETGRLDALTARIDTVPALIRLLGQIISPEVLLDVLEEGNTGDAGIGIRVQAWSPSDQMAQRFASDVQQAMRPLRLSVAQTDLQAAKGRTGSQGYSVSFWLIPMGPDEMEVQP